MDVIHVTQIRAYGYTGFLAEEQVLGQWFEVDLSLWLDLSPAGDSDAIADTVDYRKAINLVKHQIQTAKFSLVEKLAEQIAAELLQIAQIKQVRVQLSKPAAPIPDFGGCITIDITRSHSSILLT
ncbi:MAG: dihydroneopterin aldolase [Chloroflexaceae bacterium]|nr:dihydroneopterin aldolase [Chloroflexaceae bacterium]